MAGTAAAAGPSRAGGGAKANPYSHNITRTSPATVVWLHEHFEPCEDMSLGREPLYKHYEDHCSEMGHDPVNQASFGKLIRSVFPSLKTRRLGTRGNSKYHYYGIRLKDSSPLIFEETQVGGSHNKYRNKPAGKASTKASGKSSTSSSTRASLDQRPSAAAGARTAHPDYAQYLRSDIELPAFPSMSSVGAGDNRDDFSKPYHAHCKEVLRCVANAEFDDVHIKMNQFWGSIAAHFKPLLKQPAGVMVVLQCDDIFLVALKQTLVPSALVSLPDGLIKQIRNFAKQLEPWTKTALDGFNDNLVVPKLQKIRQVSHFLRRFTSLNHLASAARSVLESESAASDMYTDLEAVDIQAIQAQAQLICPCPREAVYDLHSQFLDLLKQHSPTDKWAEWLQGVLRNFVGSGEDAGRKAKTFVLRWCLYSSLVIRDLTLRSAVSFGSFHLTRLFLDELVAWLVERLAEQGLACLDPSYLKASPLVTTALDFHHGGSCVAPNPEVPLEHF